jgi:hypothetical protein
MEIPLFPDLTVALRKALDSGPHVEMLQHFCYWFHPRHPKMQNRWTMFKTFAEWRDECGLSERQVYKGRKRLRELRLVTEKRGSRGRIHYRVDWLALARALSFDTVGVETDDDDVKDLYPDNDFSFDTVGVEAQFRHQGVEASFDTVGVDPNSGDYAGEYEQENFAPTERAGEPAKAEPPADAQGIENPPKRDEAVAGSEQRHSVNGRPRSETPAATNRAQGASDPAPAIPPDAALLERVRAILSPESGQWWGAHAIDRNLAGYRPELVVETMLNDPELPESVREANVGELLPAVTYALWERRQAASESAA